ncbi:MAG: 30S ribosomal protein S8 [Caldisphaeraceae archaeon]|nr:30S ribosomal protein S8 [Caldisphaeraceae archaeon]MEB3691364.1 30S ribosomal protein S8 [Caldisphaeraceae archaeon]MEB3798523.1 30S ribosomal protein S8 [Caldisphaeraceae archaeon]
MVDVLANHLSSIMNSEARGKREAVLIPASKLTASILRVLQREGYIGEFEYIDDGRHGKFKVQLMGRINKIGVVKPRISIRYNEILRLPESLRRFLASKDMGYLILSTNQGIMTHKEALSKRIGGVVLAYVY